MEARIQSFNQTIAWCIFLLLFGFEKYIYAWEFHIEIILLIGNKFAPA